MDRTHKVSGWRRVSEPAGDATAGRTGAWRIIPTDGTGDRVVMPMSAGSWCHLPGDTEAARETDRIILMSGAPLPDWAAAWVLGAWQRDMRHARAAFQAALDDADSNAFGRDTGW